jgi:hypothetical protein
MSFVAYTVAYTYIPGRLSVKIDRFMGRALLKSIDKRPAVQVYQTVYATKLITHNS